MSLKDTLFEDLKSAMKNKDTIRKDTIQIVRAAILQIEKDEKVQVDDSRIVNIISKELKKRYDVAPDFEKSGRTDLIEDLNRQISILKTYLPEQLSEQELTLIIEKTIEDISATTIKDMGKVMGAVNPKVLGRADSKSVSDIVKRLLI